MTIEVLAYTAGIIDGEGHIGSQLSPNPNPLVQVCMRAESVIEFLHEHFGGGRTVNNKGLFVWYVTGKQVAPFLYHIYPYLRVKQKAAALAIQMSQLIGPGGRSKYVSPEAAEKRELLHWMIKEENALYNKGVMTLEKVIASQEK